MPERELGDGHSAPTGDLAMRAAVAGHREAVT